GRGTAFRIYLPRTRRVGADGPKALPASSTETPSGAETILLVEDEAGVRQFATLALTKRGYNVIEAQTAGEALTLLEQRDTSVDMLLTDVVLPGLDGRELASRVGTHRPDIRVLFTTGYTDRRNQLLEPGAPLLEKPFTARALLTKTREVLDGTTGAPCH